MAARAVRQSGGAALMLSGACHFAVQPQLPINLPYNLRLAPAETDGLAAKRGRTKKEERERPPPKKQNTGRPPAA